MILHKKFRQSNRFNKGTLLFIAMITTALAGGFILSSYQKICYLRKDLQEIKKIHKEKQVLIFAQWALSKLKKLATDDFIIPYKNDEKLHFYDVRTKEIRDLGTIDLALNKSTCRVFVDVLEDDSYDFCCAFQENGLRKIMMDECFREIPHSKKDEIKKRWEILQSENELSTPLFLPLIKQCEILNNNLTVDLYNPFDRPLSGSVKIKVQGYERKISDHNVSTLSTIPKNIEKSVVLNLLAQGSFTIKINFPEDFFIQKICVGNLCLEKNLTSGRYQIVYSDLDKPFKYTLKTSIKSRKLGAWGRKAKTENTLVQNETRYSLPIFETKNWIQQLNACCFFCEKTRPYRIIDNFDMKDDDGIKLRDFFWNFTIKSPQAISLNFNGSEVYLKNQFKKLGFFNSDVELDKEVKNILLHQPYGNAIDFLEQLKIYQNKMEFFEKLTHRTETFFIQSFYENIRCDLVVYRTCIGPTYRDWKIKNIKIISEKYKYPSIHNKKRCFFDGRIDLHR